MDPLQLWQTRLEAIASGFLQQIPNLIMAALFCGAIWLAAGLAASAIRRLAVRRGRPDLGSLLASLVKGGMMIAAALFAAAIVFPSVKPADILATLGIGSIAIGFAFKDILQNLLAGILLLLRRPFRAGDQIVVREFEGTVEHIESRATILRTYDGRRIIVPNSDIYTSPVVVNTAFGSRRQEIVVGTGYGDSLPEVIAAFRAAVGSVEGVLATPPVEVMPWAFGDSSINVLIRWWAASPKIEQVAVRARVVLALRETAARHGIDLPFPTSVVLFHDQTEVTDGDRRQQREGWPARGDGDPEPRWRAQARRERVPRGDRVQ